MPCFLQKIGAALFILVPRTVLGMEQGFNKCLLNLMEQFVKVLKFIMSTVHFVQLPPLNFKRPYEI